MQLPHGLHSEQTTIKQRHLKALAIGTAVLWAALLVVPLYSSWTAPLPDNPRIKAFAEEFRITTTLETLAFFVSGVFLSLWAWVRRSSPAALAVAFTAAGALWWSQLSSAGIFFRAPLGDGTISGALQGWWRLHRPSIGIHSARILFFLVSIIVWSFVSFRLSSSRARKSQV
jgi:hypothetical protein